MTESVLSTAETMTPAKRPRMNWILVSSGISRSGRKHSLHSRKRAGGTRGGPTRVGDPRSGSHPRWLFPRAPRRAPLAEPAAQGFDLDDQVGHDDEYERGNVEPADGILVHP